MTKMQSDNSTLFLSGDCAIYIGRPLVPDTHSHYATQLSISIGSPLVLKTERSSGSIECDGVVIGKNLEHSINADSGIQILMFIENGILTFSDSLNSLDSKASFNDQILMSFQKPSAALAAAIHNSLNSEEPTLFFEELIEQLVKHFGLSLKQDSIKDSRISKILNWINSEQKLTKSIKQIADSISLSESRLQHLFKKEVGIPIRRYMLWRKLKHVVYGVTKGQSLTDAAHESGFSDSAHFSRTFRSMFGISPSSIFSPKKKLKVYVNVN